MKNLDMVYLEKCRSALSVEQTESLSETNNWAQVDKQQVHADWDTLYKELALLVDNAMPGDEKIQEIIGRHFKITCRFYHPSKDAYIGMGLFYSENQEMKAFHNAYHPKMTEFLGDAMSIYAQENLVSTNA